MSDSDRPRPRDGATETVARMLPPPLGAVIRVSGVRASPAEYRLSLGRCVVGAGSKADLIIDDETASREHVALTLCPQGVEVEDLGSSNGTFYLGQRIEKVTLSPGSRIRVGKADLAIDADTSELTNLVDDTESYRGIIGKSEAMRHLFALLARLEGSLVNVLVEGESGVGKELVAQAIHRGSRVAAGPFVVLNCGTLSRELALSELFGHRQGAFTGATEDRPGAFVSADGGTLFLDEVGELPLDVQPTLLRALESGEVKAVGATHPNRVQVRVVAATNRQLRAEVEAGRFREDLYYRLAVIAIRVVPLRERRDDVTLLVHAFARRAGAPDLPADMLGELRERPWRGNVRELRNAVEAYLALGDLTARPASSETSVDQVMRSSVDPDRPYTEERDKVLDAFHRAYLPALLERCGGNISEAARRCGIERSYLGKLLKRYGTRP